MHQQLRICVTVNDWKLFFFIFFFLMHMLALNQSHVLAWREKYILPGPALFRTTQASIPRAVHLREKRECGYINIFCKCVCEREESYGDAERV